MIWGWFTLAVVWTLIGISAVGTFSRWVDIKRDEAKERIDL